ncbi:MAG: hypothetical protein LQ343_002098 [Gyalolechia ehrenbergii]|nr:MAG: hypothetical protein LQ343_002098 [Gyalolechia ehrenbergii]
MFSSALKSFSSNISANYTISSTPTTICGAWKIYDGKKKSTGRAVSIFVFERRSLDAQAGGLGLRSSSSSVRKVHEEVIARVKKESNLLARLRHPSILELAEPIEDTRSGGLMFATEPVTASLAGLLQEKDDQEQAGGVAGRPSRFVVEDDNGQLRRRELEIDELEIQKGLLQVAQGLEFLHESAGLVHGNLTPESIYVNAKSDWKIAGLAFAGPPDNSDTSSSIPPISLAEVLYHDPRLPRSLQLNLDYASPDFVIDNNIAPAADMFSLGLLILALYNSPHASPLKTNFNISTYKKLFSSSISAPSSTNNFLSLRPLPKDLLNSVLSRLITRRPGQRMNAREFQHSQFFDNILISSIRFLDSLPAKNPNEKSQFMRGLPKILNQFPRTVLEKKVLPALLEEIKDREILFLVLQNVFKIVKSLPSRRRIFTEKIIPKLREAFIAPKGSSTERDTAKEAGLVIVLENTGLIGESCSGKEFKEAILPIIKLGLESHTHSIVDKSLGCLPTIMAVLDFSTIKHEVFPIVAAVFSKTSSLGIKIRGLEAFVVLCGGSSKVREELGDGLDGLTQPTIGTKISNNAVLDKYTVQEKVVPLLKAMKTKEPAVVMAALAVFNQIGKMADTDFLAIECLPILWGFALGPLLNLPQFQEYMASIKALSARIENEQTRKLRELSSNSKATRSNDLMTLGSTDAFFGTTEDNVGESDFERLVLGKGTTNNEPDMLGGTVRPQPQRSQSSRVATPVFSWSTSSANPAQNHVNGASTMGSLGQSPASSARPAHAGSPLNNFAALQPTPPPSVGQSMGNQTTNGFGFMTPMQPSSLQPSQSTLNTTTPHAQSFNSPLHAQSKSNFSITPPTNATSPFSQFSIAPPPAQSQTTLQGQYGKGIGISSSQMNTTSNHKQKTGLDAYESLL